MGATMSGHEWTDRCTNLRFAVKVMSNVTIEQVEWRLNSCNLMSFMSNAIIAVSGA